MTNSDQPIVAQATGVRITARARGAHLMQWTTEGVDRLWMSPASDLAQAGALRGGVPVLFPQFATFGPLPKHGFARTTLWNQAPTVAEPGRAVLAFELSDTERTREQWPHAFRARLVISASAQDLIMGLTVHNDDPGDVSFTGGLHTYLAIRDPEASITGLAGSHEWDGVSTEDPSFTHPIGGPLRALDTQDRVISGATDPVVLHDRELGQVSVTARGFTNRVVWNPGPGHDLPDVPPGDEAHFVCVEPTSVVPVTLPPGGVWEVSQQLSLG